MTPNCREAFNTGVQAVLDIAVAAAAKARAMPWKPGREGAAAALEALAESGKMLLDQPSVTAQEQAKVEQSGE